MPNLKSDKIGQPRRLNIMKSLVSGNKVILEFELGEYDKNIVDLLTMMEIASKSKATENWYEKVKVEFCPFQIPLRHLLHYLPYIHFPSYSHIISL